MNIHTVLRIFVQETLLVRDIDNGTVTLKEADKDQSDL